MSSSKLSALYKPATSFISMRTRVLMEIIWGMVVLMVVGFVYISLSNSMEWLFAWGLTFCDICPDDAFNTVQALWNNWPILVVGVVVLYIVIRAVRTEPVSQEVFYR